MRKAGLVKIVMIALVSGGLVLGASLAIGSDAARGPVETGAAPDPAPGKLWNLAPDQQAAVGQSAAQARDRIAEARQARADGKPENALTSLEQARTMLEGVLDASPAVRAKSRLWVAQNVAPHESSEAVLGYLESIQAELAALQSYAAAGPAKEHLDRATEHLKKGESVEAVAELQAANEAVTLGAAETPAAETFYLVNIALAAIAQSDDAVAEEVLEAAQKSADALVAAMPMPIQQASAGAESAAPVVTN